MSGLKLVLPTSFTDTSLPILRDDPLLSAGSLLLLEPAHPARPMAAGIPASGGAVPNIAHAEAAALLGGSHAVGTLDNTLNYAGLSGTKGLLERSGKGGIHGLVSQAVALTAGDGAQMVMNNALTTYLFNNQGHSFYISFWDRITRINAGTVTSTGAVQVGVIGSNSNTANFTAYRVNTWLNTTGASSANPVVPANAVGPRFGCSNPAALSAMTNFSNGTGGPIWGAPLNTYNASGAIFPSRNNMWPSSVFYRMYVEDLTVSGRTYAAVQAEDQAEYQKQVLTAGGRYYNDTYTNPTTVA